MSKLIFIGTLHAGLTPHKELQEVLGHYKPEVLLIEIQQIDIASNTLSKYPDEMVFALSWAHEKGISVYGFDSPIDVFAKGRGEKENQAVIEEQKEILKSFSWKDANKQEVCDKLYTSSAKTLVNPAKDKEREEEMLKNVKNRITDQATIVVVTGSGHLQFFEKHFPDALFPLR